MPVLLAVRCRDELEAMIEARVRDFRIDARLRRVCKDQMQDCIGMDIYEGDETIVNICLQVRAQRVCWLHTLLDGSSCDMWRHTPLFYEVFVVRRPWMLGINHDAQPDPVYCLQKLRLCLAKRQPSCQLSSSLCCCLQDNLAQGLIPEGACKNMVYEYQQLAAQDIRFDVPLADACHTDRQKLCGNVPPVRGADAAGSAGCCRFRG